MKKQPDQQLKKEEKIKQALWLYNGNNWKNNFESKI
jgi:hypothetical protein